MLALKHLITYNIALAGIDCDTEFVDQFSAQPARHTHQYNTEHREHERNCHFARIIRTQPEINSIEHDEHKVDRHMNGANLFGSLIAQRNEIDNSRDSCQQSPDEAAQH